VTGPPVDRDDPGGHAARALITTAAGDHEGAAQAIRALADAGALTGAMHRWVDTLVDQSTRHGCPVPVAPSPGALPRHRQPAGATGQDQDGARWAQQFLTARAGMDHCACARLIKVIPDGQAEQYAGRLVEAVSGRFYMIAVADLDPWG
jgi:hypothetical protein